MPRPRSFAPVLVLLLAACAQGNTGLGSGSGSEGGSAPTGCEPGTSAPCYTGPEGTEGLGICRAGSAVCREDGVSYGDCESQVLPAIEDCASGLDEDCDGDILDADAGCVCAPNTANLCYDGPAGTKDVGLCVGGTSVCGADGKGFAPCAGQGTIKPLMHQHAVGQAGEHIKIGTPPQLFFRALALGDVGVDANIARRQARRVAHGRD